MEGIKINENDLLNIEVGGSKPYWIFLDDWGTSRSEHKDGDIFLVEKIGLEVSNDGKKEFPSIQLIKNIGSDIEEVYKISLYALKRKIPIKAKDLIGKKIKLSKNGNHLNYELVE